MKWLHNLLKGTSLATALFIFQACYGSPQDYFTEEGGEAPMTFVVSSNVTGTPLEGIRIQSQLGEDGNWQFIDLGVTGADGRCKVEIPYLRNIKGPTVRFEDPQGNYAVKDTVLYDLREQEIKIKLYDQL